MRNAIVMTAVVAIALAACAEDRREKTMRLFGVKPAAEDEAARAEQPAPILATPSTMPAIADGRARVVVYIGNRNARVGFQPTVVVNGAKRGTVKLGDALYVDIAPGSPKVTLETWTANSLSVPVRERETAYVRIEQTFRGAATPKLRRIDQAEGKEDAESRSARRGT